MADEIPKCPDCGKEMARWSDSGKHMWICLDQISGKCKVKEVEK